MFNDGRIEMKIKRHSKELLESKLLEAEAEVETDGLIDLEDSTDEIATEISDTVALASGGEVGVSDSEADRAAKEIKDAAAEVGADHAAFDPGEDFEFLGVDNPITRVLDIALRGARRDKRRGGKFGHNVLISGLPGSGKTATVYDWAYANGINLVEVNAKNNDLDAYINGYTARDMDDPKWTTQAYSKNLMDLDKPNSVLFLDEYNRQVKQSIRGSLYSLINNHKIVGDGPNKTYEFKNMLFTIAAINPAIRTDKGATPLNDAEKTRFVHKLKNLDSTPETTIEFLNKYYGKKIRSLKPEDEYYREDLEGYLRALDIGMFVMTHPEFHYDGEEQLIDLDLKQETMLNQRSFVEGLNESDGDIDAFKTWVQYSSDFLEPNVEMLLSILKGYIKPSFEELCKGHGIDPALGTIKAPASTTKPTKEPDAVEGTDIEDDDDFFVKSDMAGKVRAKQPYEIEAAVTAAIKDW
jgi:hypothetical protein